MPTFTYTARDEQGAVQSGNLDAVDEDQLVALLQQRGLLVTAITQRDLGTKTRRLEMRRAPKRRKLHTGVKVSDHVLLCQQLAVLVDAGVPLLRSLEVVTNQCESRRLMLALEDVRRDVEGGSTFRDALARHSAIFSALWLNLVETGEASGHLAQSLQQLARHFEAAQHLRNEVQTALMYPTMLIVAMIAVLVFFIYWLIPRFTPLFTTMGVELPLITRIMISISEGGRRYAAGIILGIAGLAFAGRWCLRTETGRWLRDKAMLQIPLFKGLFTAAQIAEFSRGLSTLLESGVPLLSGLQILEKSATNKLYAEAISGVREAVKEGKPMAETMEKTGLFTAIAVQMVQVGEEVGELSKMTARVASYYEAEVDVFISRMTRMFEPIAIVVMGGLVLAIVSSIFLPIFKLAGSGGVGG